MQVKIIDRLSNVSKLLIFQVILTLGLWLYFKGTFGVYKHKYINELQAREKDFKQRLNEFETKQKSNRKKVITKTKKLKHDVSRIEKKRINDNKTIDDADVSDDELERFLAKHRQKNR